MKYLIVCCLVMLAIALAHSAPSQSFQERLRSLAKAKSNRQSNTYFGRRDSLQEALRGLKAKTSRGLDLRTGGSRRGTFFDASGCKDYCGFFSIDWYGDDPFQELEDTFECAEEKGKELEADMKDEYFGKDLVEAAGADIEKLWEVRMDDTKSTDEKVVAEIEFEGKIMEEFEASGQKPSQHLIDSYQCLKKEIYVFLYILESFGLK